MAADRDEQFEIRHVLFIDIVGYSKLLIEEQKDCLRRLTEIVLATPQVQRSSNEQLVRLPTGDGMALVFRDSAEEPAQCAFEIAKSLKEYSEIDVRMGIHSGPVSEVTDLNDRTNIAGAGINMAQRVMDCGDAGHILASRHVADSLESYARWKPHVHHLSECEVKHGVRLQLANLYSNDAGNPAMPRKLRKARRRRTGTVLGLVIGLTAIAAATGLLIQNRVSVTSAKGVIPDKSIAVLPFTNLSADKNNAYFAAGMRDEILTRLANLRDLKVIARTSTEQYESHPTNLEVIASELGVAHLLEGSVQKLGNTVHVNVQLIKAITGAHVWAQSYDRTLENAFAVQGEIAQTVANALQVALAPKEVEQLTALPTHNTSAYDAYLRGEYALEQARKNPGDYQSAFDPAIAAFQEAIAADPQFARAYAQLAYAEITKEQYSHLDGRTTRKPELLVSAKQNIDRALQLDPNLPLAHLALGRWHYASRNDWNTAVAEYQRALQLNPGLSEAKARIASSLLAKGQTAEAIQVYLQGLELDPRNYQLLRNLGIAYTMRREYDKAKEIDARIVAFDPADELDSCNLAMDYVQTAGDLKGARRVLDELISHLPPGKGKGSRLTSTELDLLIFERDFSRARSYAEKLPADNWETEWKKPQLLGDIEQFAGNRDAAREQYQNARVLLLAAMSKNHDEPQMHAELGAVSAALGLREEALREAQRALDLEPPEKSARAGLLWQVNLALVHARLGNHDEAIATLERVMAMPNSGDAISPWQLKLDPIWDPLRKNPRFEKLSRPSASKV